MKFLSYLGVTPHIVSSQCIFTGYTKGGTDGRERGEEREGVREEHSNFFGRAPTNV